MVGGGAGLEDRLGLENPGGGGIDPPQGMRRKDRGGVREIPAVIGAKIESRPLPRPRRKHIEERWLQQAVFVMAPLGPWIGEKYNNCTYAGVSRQGGEKVMCLSMEKMEIGQLGAVAFAGGARDALTDEINAHAQFPGMRRRVGGEKMPVAAADFAQKMRSRRQHARQRGVQVGTALRDERAMDGAGIKDFHRADLLTADYADGRG
jgi:hypothetical protein